MPSASSSSSDTQTLAALSVALVNSPRANLQELAQSIGISKATLYRFCRTRDELIERLGNHSVEVLNQTIELIDLNADPIEMLQTLTERFLERREVSSFLTYYWVEVAKTVEGHLSVWERSLDAFFLNGQQRGVFRLDISAQALTETWTSVMVGLIEAERRGRVARAGLSSLTNQLFLEGAKA